MSKKGLCIRKQLQRRQLYPPVIRYTTSVDMVECYVRAALGQTLTMPQTEPMPYYATHNLRSVRNGLFRQVCFSKEIEPYIIRKCVYKKPGDSIEYFDNAAKAVGIVFLKFNDQATMIRYLEQASAHISVIVD